MKLLTLAILFAITTFAFGNEDDFQINLKSIWVEQGHTPGKQYLASLGSDELHDNDRIMIFGKKNEKMKSRFINVRYFGLPVLIGSTRAFHDDFYSITITRLDEDTLSFDMVGAKPGFEYSLIYKKLSHKQFLKIQAKAWPLLIKEHKRLYKIAKIHTPKSIKQLKDIALLLESSEKYWNDSSLFPWQFEETLDEIDSHILVRPSDSKIAKSQITSDGTDLISQTFIKDGRWTKDSDLPNQEQIFENNGDEAWRKRFYTYYHKLPQGNLKEGSFKRGLKKFLKVAILVRTPWECEGDFAWQTDYIWVLKDGSSIEYSSEFECD